jgi:hypothetical protein
VRNRQGVILPGDRCRRGRHDRLVLRLLPLALQRQHVRHRRAKEVRDQLRQPRLPGPRAERRRLAEEQQHPDCLAAGASRRGNPRDDARFRHLPPRNLRYRRGPGPEDRRHALRDGPRDVRPDRHPQLVAPLAHDRQLAVPQEGDAHLRLRDEPRDGLDQRRGQLPGVPLPRHGGRCGRDNPLLLLLAPPRFGPAPVRHRLPQQRRHQADELQLLLRKPFVLPRPIVSSPSSPSEEVSTAVAARR